MKHRSKQNNMGKKTEFISLWMWQQISHTPPRHAVPRLTQHGTSNVFNFHLSTERRIRCTLNIVCRERRVHSRMLSWFYYSIAFQVKDLDKKQMHITYRIQQVFIEKLSFVFYNICLCLCSTPPISVRRKIDYGSWYSWLFMFFYWIHKKLTGNEFLIS